MRVLLFLLFCIFPITSFASEFSFNHTETVDLVFLSSGLSLQKEYRNCDINRQTEYFPGLKTFDGNMSNFVHIPGMTVFTSDDVQMPGEKKNILDLSPSSRGSVVPLHFLLLEWYHLHT